MLRSIQTKRKPVCAILLIHAHFCWPGQRFRTLQLGCLNSVVGFGDCGNLIGQGRTRLLHGPQERRVVAAASRLRVGDWETAGGGLPGGNGRAAHDELTMPEVRTLRRYIQIVSS